MHNNRKQFFVLALAFLMSMFFRSYFGVVGPMVAADIDLDPSRYGYAASAFFISFGLLQMPLGSAFDRFGAGTPMTVLMIVGAMGAALVAMARTAGQLVAGQAVLGAGRADLHGSGLSVRKSWRRGGRAEKDHRRQRCWHHRRPSIGVAYGLAF